MIDATTWQAIASSSWPLLVAIVVGRALAAVGDHADRTAAAARHADAVQVGAERSPQPPPY